MRLRAAVMAIWAVSAAPAVADPPPCVEETLTAARIACLTAAADAAMAEADTAALGLAATLSAATLASDLPARIDTAQRAWRERVERACAGVEAPGPRFAEAMRQTCRRTLAEARRWRLSGDGQGHAPFTPYVRLRPSLGGGGTARPEVLLALPPSWP